MPAERGYNAPDAGERMDPFTQEELSANRQGELHLGQRSRYEGMIRTDARASLGAFSVAAILAVVVVVGVHWRVADLNSRFPTLHTDIPYGVVAFLLALACTLPLVLGVVFRRDSLEMAQKLAASQLEHLEGPVELQHLHSRTGTRQLIVLQGRVLSMAFGRRAELTQGKRYRLHALTRLNEVLSYEALD